MSTVTVSRPTPEDLEAVRKSPYYLGFTAGVAHAVRSIEKTHIVQTTYQQGSEPWRVRAYCGREWEQGETTLGRLDDAKCRTCELAVARLAEPREDDPTTAPEDPQ